jgi:hypothetical protein
MGVFRAEKMSQKGQIRHAKIKLEDGRCRALGDHPRDGAVERSSD